MTKQAAEAAQNMPNLPVLQDREDTKKVGIIVMSGDRGLAGAFNSQIIRAAMRATAEHEAEGREVQFFVSGRRGASSLNFRGREPKEAYAGHTDRPVLRQRAGDRRRRDRLLTWTGSSTGSSSSTTPTSPR